jgi:putative Ca2+/H+ antiporter (TMEM165/GDT1 family)
MVEWKIVLSSFLLVFLAEIGDKTQLAIVGLAVREKNPLAVLLGAVGALVITTVVAVALGEAIAKLVPLHYIRRVAGSVFVLFGVLILLGK